jgi:hypothetical protein
MPTIPSAVHSLGNPVLDHYIACLALVADTYKGIHQDNIWSTDTLKESLNSDSPISTKPINFPELTERKKDHDLRRWKSNISK